MKNIVAGIICIVLLGLSACVQQPSYPPYPIITFQSVSKTLDSLPTVISQDSLLVTIGFTDGGGGIGPPAGTTDTATSIVPCTQHWYDNNVINNPAYNVFWYEYHAPSISTDSCIDRLATAYVPTNGKSNSIAGTIQFYPAIECPPSGTADTLIFSIFIKDRNGNLSNRVRTPPIIIKCP